MARPASGPGAVAPDAAAPAAPGDSASASPSTVFLTVNTLADENDGYTVGASSLREAIDQANLLGGANTIVFSVLGTLDLNGPLPEIANNLTILGPGSSSLTVRRNTGGDYRIFSIATGYTATISGLTLSNGKADNTGGGGIANYGTLSVTDCNISNNFADSFGGGILNAYGTLTVSNSTISGNSTGNNGGGLYSQTGTVKISGSTFAGNSSGQYGGGILARYTTLTITTSTIAGNSDGVAGGGLSVVDGATALTNVTFSGNSSSGSGGGIVQYSGTLTIDSGTLADNRGNGGGIYLLGGSIALKNTILSHNAGAQCVVYGGTLASQGYNLASDTTCNLTQSSDRPNTDPHLLPLSSYGGSTQTCALAYDSPALDNGPSSGAPSTDQRGQSRPTDGNGDGTAGADIGAYEAAANSAPVLNNTGEPVLDTINEDPTSNPGTLVKSILATGANKDPISDSDGDPEGVAIVGADTTGGSWQYAIGSGGQWTALGTVSASAALLLPSDSYARLRFVPNADYNGTQTLTFRAWDQRYGTAGAAVDLSKLGTGGTTSFSSATETASITVASINDTPTISAISDATTNEDTATSAISFKIGDVETAASSLTLTGASSNTTLLPVSNIVFGGSGADRTVTLTPAKDQNGSAVVTITVSDGAASAKSVFALTVNAVNDAPILSHIGDQTVSEDGVTQALAFTVADAETAASSLTITASASNKTLVPDGSYTFGGSGGSRTLIVTPAADQNGTATITLTVSDGTTSTSDTFLLTVTAVNDAPTVSSIADQVIDEDTPTGALPFTVGDVETSATNLSITASSSDTTLFPSSSFKLGGSGSSRTLTVTPAANQSGQATITLAVSDGSATTKTNFSITVNTVNDPPTVSNIADQSTNEDTATGSIAFSLADVESGVDSLTLSAASSNTNLVPIKNIAFSGTGANRTLVVTPAKDQNGTATITVSASDGTDSGSDSFLLTVKAVNDAPTVSTIEDVTTNEDTPTQPIAFTLGDVDSTSLTVTASSSNTTLLPSSGIKLAGSGTDRTITLTPAANQSGTATVTITVSDGAASTSSSFAFVVNAVNDLPTVTTIADQTINEDAATSAITFTVGDVETGASSLVVTAASSDTKLLPNENIKLAGSGASRNVTCTPAANQNGSAVVTIKVSDGTGTGTTSFTLTVKPVNDAPTVSNVADKTILEDETTGPLEFTVGDAETALGSLVVTATSSNQTLVPNGNITLDGEGADRTIEVAPAANQAGTATITLKVSDGTTTASDTFVLTVTAVNDPPTVTAIADQTTKEDVPTAAIAFTIGDVETSAGSLSVTAVADDLKLVPKANVKISGTSASRTLTLTPAANLSGETVVTLTVADSGASTSISFKLTVEPVNDLPTATKVADQTVKEDTPTAALTFTVGDVETDPSLLELSGASSNEALVPAENITFGGSGANRTVTVLPAQDQVGTATISILVDDGTDTGGSTFKLTVSAVNDAPTVSEIEDQFTREDTPTSAIPFTIGDAETTASSLKVTATSSNTTVVPGANLKLGGTGADRTITITPASHQSGDTTITLTVSDGSLSSSTAFNLRVFSQNNPPSITAVEDQATDEDIPLLAIPFTVDDVETASSSLKVTAVSSDKALVPAAGLVIEGQEGDRLLSIAPAANRSGEATITLSVNDGESTTSTSFDLTVAPVNDAPTVTDLGDQTTAEDVPLRGVPVSVGDVESAAEGLELTAKSSNPLLLPDEGITFDGSGADRSMTLTPLPNQNGTTTVTLTVGDGEATTTDTFVLTVTPVADAPAAKADVYTMTEDVPLVVEVDKGVLANDVDPDGDVLKAKIGDAPAHGKVVLAADGSFTYTPNASFNGSDAFTYTASDGKLSSPKTKVTLTIDPVEDGPIATDDAYAGLSDAPLAVPAGTGVLANDVDADNDPLTLELVIDVEHGTLDLAADGSFTYTPDTGFTGVDTFTYRISDPSGAADDGTVTLTLSLEDADLDGIDDRVDNCLGTVNADQIDTDQDGQGDACDTDDDGDELLDEADNCPRAINTDQVDTDQDGQGDACDTDDDGDGVEDSLDNCPLDPNADQADGDGNGVGDVCDPTPEPTPTDDGGGCGCMTTGSSPGPGALLLVALGLGPLLARVRRRREKESTTDGTG